MIISNNSQSPGYPFEGEDLNTQAKEEEASLLYKFPDTVSERIAEREDIISKVENLYQSHSEKVVRFNSSPSEITHDLGLPRFQIFSEGSGIKMWRHNGTHLPTYLAKKIGTGSFSKVYLLMNIRTGDVDVFKKAKNDVKSKNLIEFAELQALNEDHIVNYIHDMYLNYSNDLKGIQDKSHQVVKLNVSGKFYQTKSEKKGRLVTLYEDFYNVHAQNRFSQEQLLSIVDQLICGLSLLHNLGIAHFDLKRNNLLFKGYEKNGLPIVHIGDYGGAIQKNGLVSFPSFTTQFITRDDYTNLNKLPKDSDGTLMMELGKKCDVFAMGIVLYEILTKRTPVIYDRDSFPKEKEYSPIYPLEEDGSLNPKDALIKDMINFNTNERPDMNQVALRWNSIEGAS